MCYKLKIFLTYYLLKIHVVLIIKVQNTIVLCSSVTKMRVVQVLCL